MEKAQRFEDILVWQKARNLCARVYLLFKLNKDYRFRDQIQAAAVSIMNNIAEGFERKGNKEFSHFLYISKGSSGEVRSMLYLALELNYITRKDFSLLYNETEEVSRMLSGLIKSLK